MLRPQFKVKLGLFELVLIYKPLWQWKEERGRYERGMGNFDVTKIIISGNTAVQMLKSTNKQKGGTDKPARSLKSFNSLTKDFGIWDHQNEEHSFSPHLLTDER